MITGAEKMVEMAIETDGIKEVDDVRVLEEFLTIYTKIF